MGLGNAFDAVVGISTGAPIGAYFLAGERQSLLGASIYYEECATPDFIDFSRRHTIVDIGYLWRVMGSGRKALDTRAIQHHRSQFYISAMNWETQRVELIDVKTARPDSLAAVIATTALPGAYGKPVTVNGTRYSDGGILPPSTDELVRRFHPTDILVLPNRGLLPPSGNVIKGADLLFAAVTLRHRSLHLAWLTAKRTAALRDWLYSLQQLHGVNVGILWPKDYGLRQLSQDSTQLKSAALGNALETLNRFGHPELNVELL
jgi:predicted acylesterase/phospholipase RssA